MRSLQRPHVLESTCRQALLKLVLNCSARTPTRLLSDSTDTNPRPGWDVHIRYESGKLGQGKPILDLLRETGSGLAL